MKLQIDVAMDYALAPNDPALLMIEVAEVPGQHLIDSALDAQGASVSRLDPQAASSRQIWVTPPTDRLTLTYRATVSVTRAETSLSDLPASPWHALPGHVLRYLRPSRLCPSDLFVPFVNREFGHLEGGAKLAAMVDWVADWMSYVPGSSDASTTAMDSFISREGVCRDYAHVVCGLARAANIPARYTTGYGPGVTPPDFHAVAEVWLKDGWHLLDATGMSTPASLAIIGSGRDAGDATFMETEGAASLNQQRVSVTEA